VLKRAYFIIDRRCVLRISAWDVRVINRRETCGFFNLRESTTKLNNNSKVTNYTTRSTLRVFVQPVHSYLSKSPQQSGSSKVWATLNNKFLM